MYTLCLSGGGFRATLYHIGVMRGLIYHDIFKNVGKINSVSGGSILAGKIMVEISKRGRFKSVEDFDNRVTIPVVKFVQSSPKRAIYKLIPIYRDPERLAGIMEDLFERMEFKDLTDDIRWNCYAAELSSAKYWEFSQNRMGNDKAGYVTGPDIVHIARGVAASACFIPVFKPIKLKKPNKENVYLIDGGVYDNQGVTDVIARKEYLRDEVIVSDASSIIEKWGKGYHGIIDMYKRGMDIAIGMSCNSRRREIAEKIVDTGHGIIMRVTDPVEAYIDQSFLKNYSKKAGLSVPKYHVVDKEVQMELGDIRTDLNAFHDLEIELLIWSGNTKIDACLKRWKPNEIKREKWAETPKFEVEGYTKEEMIKILRRGDKTRIFETHKNLHKGMKFIDKIKVKKKKT